MKMKRRVMMTRTRIASRATGARPLPRAYLRHSRARGGSRPTAAASARNAASQRRAQTTAQGGSAGRPAKAVSAASRDVRAACCAEPLNVCCGVESACAVMLRRRRRCGSLQRAQAPCLQADSYAPHTLALCSRVTARLIYVLRCAADFDDFSKSSTSSSSSRRGKPTNFEKPPVLAKRRRRG